MSRNASCFLLALVFLFSFSACVSKSKYVQLEGTLTDTRQQLKQEEQNRQEGELKISQLEAERQNCSNELTKLQDRYSVLEKQNLATTREMEALKRDVETGRATIEQQKRVITQLDETRRSIEETLKKEISNKEVKIQEMEGKLKVTFVDKILFDTGSAQINKRGKELLLQVADSLKKDKSKAILIEGHTDDVPIGADLKDKFPSNWELSTARATAVVRFLQDKGGLDPQRLSASGYSYFQPVASNDTPEGRSQNRRIEIVLNPAPIQAKAEPGVTQQ